MKKALLLTVIFFISTKIFSQNELIVQKNSQGLYLEHTVTPKENFYSVGRLYKVSPKEIASFNALDMNKGLNIGQVIKIPLNPNNFNQKSSVGRAIYYVVPGNEGIMSVSNENNKVLLVNLRKWNHLSHDRVNAGDKLIVGFLNSPQADKITVTNTASITQAPPAVEPPLKEDTNKDIARQKVETISRKEDIKPINEQPVQKKIEPNAVRTVSNTNDIRENGKAGGGYFHNQFDQQVKAQSLKADLTATAGIFKTSSGWQDAKYYALLDNVDPGTIIKIMNPTNNKAIYAKVLGSMSGIRQNQGYDIRISNAAASELEITETDKFIVRVVY
jgi:LysM domain.